MWLEHQNYREIRTALHRGKEKELDHVLHQIIVKDSFRMEKPKICPSCGKNLSQRALPYLEFFVSACPDAHGAWISPELSKRLKEFIREQMMIAGRKKQMIRFVRNLVLFIAGLMLLNNLPALLGDRYSAILLNMNNSAINENHWPERNLLLPEWPLQGGIEMHDELLYFQQWSMLLKEAISNRMNIDAVLQTRRRPEKYWAALTVYLQHEKNILHRLTGLEVPDRLKEFHQHVLNGMDAEVVFYTALTKAKSDDPSLQSTMLSKEPSLQAVSGELRAAYGEFMKLYPKIDRPTHDAVEQRLCWLDLV